jgi:hypothetical protein
MRIHKKFLSRNGSAFPLKAFLDHAVTHELGHAICHERNEKYADE